MASICQSSVAQGRTNEVGKHQLKSGGKPCVFLDRDGVLNVPSIRDGRPHPPAYLEEFKLYEDASKGCARLKQAGFLLVVVSNQPDVGRGIQSRTIVNAMNDRLAALIPILDGIETCFHGGADFLQPCLCRKPKPGMLYRAAETLLIDLPNSYLIGDRWRDVDCAKAAGCRAIFIDRGYSESLRQLPDATVASFDAAVSAVLKLAGRDSLPASPGAS
jgi:D-glycero-D-manno-heptose 1,7-bisphosphate phosphatase